MIAKFRTYVGLFALLAIILAPCGSAADEYVDYQPTNNRTPLFQLFFDRADFGYEVKRPDAADRFVFAREQVRGSDGRLVADGTALTDKTGFVFGDGYPFDVITDISVARSGGYTTLNFYATSDADTRYGSRRRGNVFNPYEDIVVPEGEFIRGTLFSITGDIEVYGEVNRNVVALLGDIFIGPDAVVRGDVVAMNGRIDLAGDASVYGEVISGADSRLGRRHRYSRFRNSYNEYLEIDGSFTGYNRVDGLSLGLQANFSDPDSLLPRAWAGGAYAFESERWRYAFGLEQAVLRHPAISIGGEAFRRLESDDNWIMSNAENTAFALLFREDFLDYYEAEGARAYLRILPVKKLEAEIGYRYEETKWLDAERDLWAVFGGDKFDYNFNAVPEQARPQGITEIDTGASATVYTGLTYETRNADEPFYRSGWSARIQSEWSKPDLESSFDYTRYKLSLTRHQRLNRRLMVLMKATYGGSDGYLPMHRRFYLGGVGSIHGYDHKEFSGRYFWMTNLEYRFNFPHSDLAAAVLWDAGQTAETSDFAGSEVKNSLGIAFYLGTDLKIGLAKRLDGAEDDKPRFFARFGFEL
jgi:hypothetical protein